MPGTSFYFEDVQVTKQKGFGKFDIADHWQRRYKGHGEDEGWYLLTNVGNWKEAVAAFKCRSGSEAMFKDCKTGGYNLEKSHAEDARLNSLILLIALAYSCAILQGDKIKKMGIQKYVGLLTESRRTVSRHSSFWIGLYGQNWVIGLEFLQGVVTELMKIRPNKLPFFQRGIRAMSLIMSAFWRGCHPVSGTIFYKIGITTRSIEERIAQVQRDVRAHYLDVAVSLLGLWEHRGNVELYFKHRYQPFNYRIGKLTEYFVFPFVKALRQDLYEMKPKVLSVVELEAIDGMSANNTGGSIPQFATSQVSLKLTAVLS
jgi:hypothetical protein